ncbi:MAG: pyridoxal-phosphate dependent enzyme [Rickettsiales bacterium]
MGIFNFFNLAIIFFMNELSFNDILVSENRIRSHILNTPIISNAEINRELNAEIFFKMDNQQVTNSFKARGAFNAVLSHLDNFGFLPKKIVAQSSGNHAQAVAYVASKLNIPAIIYMATNVSKLKIEATRKLGAEVVLCERRADANRLAEEKQNEGYFFIHPSDNDAVIAGQGTCLLEALNEVDDVEAVFAPCGGGGLLSGCIIAKDGFNKNIKIIGCEPLNGNDAFRSVLANKIVGYDESPNTVADGARTLKISERCFHYLKKLNQIIEIPEENINYWQHKLSDLLEQKIEPTSALSIAGCQIYLQRNPDLNNKKFLAILTGGNL